MSNFKFTTGKTEFTIQDLRNDLNREFIHLHQHFLTKQPFNYLELDIAAQKYFDSHRGDFVAHNAFFNNFTIIWRWLLELGYFGAAEEVWESAMAPAIRWESTHPSRRLHKGTPYYFRGMTVILRGDIARGFLLMHQALTEDVETFQTPFPDTPANAFVTLNYQKQDQAFRNEVQDTANFLDELLVEYRRTRGKTLTLDEFRNHLFKVADLRGSVFLLVFALFRAKAILKRVRPDLRMNDFAGLLESGLLFDICLVIDSAIRYKNHTKWKFADHVEFLSSALRFNLNKDRLSKLVDRSSPELIWSSQDISYLLMWHSLTPELLACDDYLDDIIIKCLKVDPDERYERFEELRDELAERYRGITGKAIELELEPRKLDAGKLASKGYSLAKLGKPKEALTYYDMAIELDPFVGSVWANKGSSLGRLGMWEEALRCFDKAIELDPEDSVPWTNKGNALDELGRTDEALKCYDRATKISPREAFAWHNKGVTLARLGRRKESLRCLDRAIKIDPKYAKAWTSRGELLDELRRHEEALRSYDKAIEANPWYVEAWMAKGGCLLGLGRYDDALGCYDKVIGIDSSHAPAWFEKGRVLAHLGKEEDTVACFDRATEIAPELADAWAAKGGALAQLGKLTEALTCYDRVIEIDEQRWKAWSAKAALLVELDKYEEALGCSRKALEISPNCVEALIPLGVALMNLGRREEAIEYYDKALRIDPRNVEAWVNKAIALGNMGRPREALKYSDKALKIDGKLFEALKCKGAVLVELGRYDEAIEYCQRAIEISPNDPELYFNMGKALGLKGRHLDAVASYKKFIELASAKSEYDESVKIAKRIVRELNTVIGLWR